ncbi:hypothetical protein SteCoe_24178 [Stentor coeruleus]|uniref:F-box domain-containing protein n=1 Tax=Stentor coeruleus TaxID=5963 RepID=A0A1R2BI27_9CILI|nr:hypothetical protein SteCoe_24178 [Stentor coeruleus]
MLSPNLYITIFSYLELWEILERLSLVSKKFNNLCKNALEQVRSAKLQKHHLLQASKCLPKLSFLTLFLPHFENNNEPLIGIENFQELKVLRLSYKRTLFFDIINIIGNDTYSRLEKIILSPTELYGCVKFLGTVPTSIRKTIAMQKKKCEENSDQEYLEKIEDIDKSYEAKLEFFLTFGYFIEIFRKKEKYLSYLHLTDNIHFIDLSEFDSDDVKKYSKIFSEIKNAKKLELPSFNINFLEKMIKNDKSFQIKQMMISIECTDEGKSDLYSEVFLRYISTKTQLVELDINMYDSYISNFNWHDINNYTITLIMYCINQPSIKWFNGLPIKHLIKDTKGILEIRIIKNDSINKLTYNLYRYFYDKLLLIDNFRVKFSNDYTKNYSKKALKDAIMSRELEIIPIFSYLERVKNVVDNFELFSIFANVLTENFSDYSTYKENTICYEEIVSFRQRFKEKLVL